MGGKYPMFTYGTRNFYFKILTRSGKKQFEAFCKTQIQLRSILFFVSDLISPNIIDDFHRVRYRLTNRNEVHVILFLRYFHLTNFRKRLDRLFTEFNLTRQCSRSAFLRMSI